MFAIPTVANQNTNLERKWNTDDVTEDGYIREIYGSSMFSATLNRSAHTSLMEHPI